MFAEGNDTSGAFELVLLSYDTDYGDDCDTLNSVRTLTDHRAGENIWLRTDLRCRRSGISEKLIQVVVKLTNSLY